MRPDNFESLKKSKEFKQKNKIPELFDYVTNKASAEKIKAIFGNKEI